jgi:hypothetical protein
MRDRRVRLIRKSKPQSENEGSTEATPPERSQPSEREIKTVVSRWVREHRQRSEEFRLTFAALMKGGGFQVPSR